MAGNTPTTVNPLTGKTDPFGLASELGPLRIAGTTDNNSAQTAEARDGKGEIIAHHVYGESMSPSADYELKRSGSFAVRLGAVSTYKGKKVMLGNVSISSAFGQDVAISASGEQVEDSAVTAHVFDAGTVSLLTSLHPQILFNAFDQNVGTNCHLLSANYTISAEIAKASAAGDCVASDVAGGKIEVQVEIIGVMTNSEASLSPGDGWTVTAPLSCSDPKADYPKWSATLTKYLTHSEIVGEA